MINKRLCQLSIKIKLLINNKDPNKNKSIMYKKLTDINMYYEDNLKAGCPIIFFIHGLG